MAVERASGRNPGALASATESPSARVVRLLREGLSEKFLMAGTQKALEKLEEAHRCAANLGQPWPQITAYRLAHVRLRLATGRDDLSCVLKLLNTAAEGDLGPMPHIYMVPVLQRLREGATPTERSRLYREIQQLVAKAREEIDRLRLARGEIPGPTQRAPFQAEVVNLLEFAAYFVGDLDILKRLEGLRDPVGDPFEGLMLGEPWVLVDSKGGSAQERLPQTIALARLDELCARDADIHLALTVPLSGQPSGIRHCAKPAPDYRPPHHEKALNLIALLAARYKWSKPAELRDRLDVLDENFRQIVSRARDILNGISGLPRQTALFGSAKERNLSLSPQLRVVAAVHRRFLS